MRLDVDFDFMAQRQLAVRFSITLIVISVLSLIIGQLNFGLDFTGGTLVELRYNEPVDLKPVRDIVNTRYTNAQVKHFGSASEIVVVVPPHEKESNAQVSEQLLTLLRPNPKDTSIQVNRVEFVGPSVGDELTEKGGLAMIGALFCILIYVALRFEYRFAVGAVAALAHDVIIVLGIFSVLQLNFDLTVLAAILAVIGYSLNDTIVVYDRIRENFRIMRKGSSAEIINTSLNQTLSRTLVTSLTTALVLLALLFFGGELIRGFAIALLSGVVIGTYSSIYVSSVMLIMMKVTKEDLAPVKKEGEEFKEEMYEEIPLRGEEQR